MVVQSMLCIALNLAIPISVLIPPLTVRMNCFWNWSYGGEGYFFSLN